MAFKDFIQEGEHIMLEMQCGDVFEGNIVNVGRNFCELINIKQYSKLSNELHGVYTFYKADVENVFKLKPKSNNSTDNCCKQNLHYTASNISKETFDNLTEISKKFIYLENADNRYFKAIHDLETSGTIGVIPLGMEKSPTTEVKLLGICTKSQVYLFDMMNIRSRAFYPELKQIFESQDICKVFHGGMSFIDILFKNYKVFTTNIFDTLLADLLIEKNKSGVPPKVTKSLASCVKVYLELPQSLLRNAQERTINDWSDRPLKSMDKFYASQLCVYLFKLQQVMKNILLRPVFQITDSWYEHIYQLDDDAFEEYIQCKEVSEDALKLIPVSNKNSIQ